MKGYRKILIAVNEADHVLDRGMRIAREEKSWVTVLKVVPSYDGDLFLTGIKNIEDALDGSGTKTALAIRQLSEKERMIVKTRIEEGPVYEKIVDVAREERCDLIVIGRPSRKRILRVFGDRTLEKVIGHAPCPVLVVERAPGIEGCVHAGNLSAAPA